MGETGAASGTMAGTDTGPLRARRGRGRNRRRTDADRRVAHLVRAVSAALLAAGLAWLPQLARAEDTVAFTITDPRITESSGLATDVNRQSYWTANDSGDSGRVFSVDGQGKTLGVANFRAAVIDVEALTMRDGRLYVGDIGDNDRNRNFVTVYVFGDLIPGGGTATYRSYDFAYPDGPHDAETLLVNTQGRIFLVTKADEGGSIYEAPANPSRTQTNTLKRVGAAPAIVTDGTVLADGRIALRTYTTIEVLDPKTYQVTARAIAPVQEQGESLTTALSGDRLLLGSEGTDQPVYSVPIPTSLTLGNSSSPTPEPTDATDSTGSDSALPAGTLSAVGLAAVVAVVAGLVAGLARSRRG